MYFEKWNWITRNYGSNLERKKICHKCKQHYEHLRVVIEGIVSWRDFSLHTTRGSWSSELGCETLGQARCHQQRIIHLNPSYLQSIKTDSSASLWTETMTTNEFNCWQTRTKVDVRSHGMSITFENASKYLNGYFCTNSVDNSNSQDPSREMFKIKGMNKISTTYWIQYYPLNLALTLLKLFGIISVIHCVTRSL